MCKFYFEIQKLKYFVIMRLFGAVYIAEITADVAQ